MVTTDQMALIFAESANATTPHPCHGQIAIAGMCASALGSGGMVSYAYATDLVFAPKRIMKARNSKRAQPYRTVRFCTAAWHHGVVTTIRAEEVRIPRHAREAIARHERVVVVNHEHPAFVIVHPDDTAAGAPSARRGRPLREALGLLADAALPDPGFVEDMEAVLADVGSAPEDPWARS